MKTKNLWEGQSGFGAEKKVEIVPIDGFELRGIVSDETKTKMVKIFMICIIIYIMTIN
jgi:hypothetical protein